MHDTPMTWTELKKQMGLERGEIIQIAKEEGVTPDTVRNRLSGRTKNDEFRERIFNRLIERKARVIAASEKLKQLTA